MAPPTVHIKTLKHPGFLPITSSDIQSLTNSLIPNHLYNRLLSMCATTYYKPPSSFLNHCNNFLTPLFVAHFQSFLITIIRETFICSGFSSTHTYMASHCYQHKLQTHQHVVKALHEQILSLLQFHTLNLHSSHRKTISSSLTQLFGAFPPGIIPISLFSLS